MTDRTEEDQTLQTPTRWSKASAFATTVVVLLGGGAGCGGGETGASSNNDEVCSTANDYVYHLELVTGRQGGFPGWPRMREGIERIQENLETLEGEVPDRLRDEVGAADAVWTRVDGVYSKYDYDPAQMPDEPSEAFMSDMSKHRPAGERLFGWIQDTCDQDPDDPDDFPTTPADAP